MELLCSETNRIQRAYKDPVFLQDNVLQQHLKLEKFCQIPANHLDQQEDIKPFMRRVVAQWMSEVCEEQQCEEEVFTLSMNFLDRVLVVTKSIARTNLQLLATACMFSASKLKETLPLTAEKLVLYTDNSITRQQLLDWEMLVLSKLKFDLSPVLAFDFLDILLDRLRLPKETQVYLRGLAVSYINILPLDEKCVVYSPSVIASACLCASIEKITNSWRAALYSRILKDLIGADMEQLVECTQRVKQQVGDKDSKYSKESSKDPPKPLHPGTPTDVLDISVN